MKSHTPTVIVFALLSVFMAVGLVIANRVIRNPAPPAADPRELAAERRRDREEVADTFQQAVPPSKADIDTFLEPLNALGLAVENQDVMSLEQRFGVDRMIREMTRQGLYRNLEAAGMRNVPRSELEAGIRSGFAQSILKNSMAWNDTEIRRVRWSADLNEAVVIARHRNTKDELPAWEAMRWWFVRVNGAWRIYDMENLHIGLRLTSTIAGAITPQFLKNPLLHAQRTRTITEALHLLAQQDIDQADQTLEPVRLADLMPFQIALRDIADGMIAVHRGDGAKALRLFDSADRQIPDMPIVLAGRAMAYNLLSRYEEALASGNKYVEALGPMAVIMLQMGVAYESLGRIDEAIAAYKSVLADEPEDEECLERLLEVLGRGQFQPLVTLIDKHLDPEKVFPNLIAAAEAAYDQDAVAAMIDAFRKRLPENPLGLQEAIKLEIKRENTKEAIRFFNLFLKLPEKARTPRYHAVVWQICSNDLILQAYSSVPDQEKSKLFAVAVRNSLFEEDDSEESNGKLPEKTRKALTALIAVREKDHPQDPWIAYAKGEMAVRDEQWQEGEKLLALSLERLPKDDDWRDTVVGRLVHVLYVQKRGLEAFRRYGGEKWTFSNLATSYENDGDAEGLDLLVKEYAAKSPDARKLAYWRGTTAWLRKDYPVAVREYRDCLKHKTKDDEAYSVFRARDRMVRSLLRTGQIKEADAEVQAMTAEEKEFNTLIPLMMAVKGEAEALRKHFREQSESNPWRLGILYRDEDLSPLLFTPKFDLLRKEFREPAPYPRSVE